ncbi:gamma-glutamylcyclotransferase family protein [Belliella marina]|uniref:Gamma-glutamylcyclotransferase family protein n=1 Tax=Belliella marina TaxID=1644146 RepID=A0ABW4VNY4_9BACT
MKEEKFLYYAYASNLDFSTLEGRLSSAAKLQGIGALSHYGFRFNVQNADGSARANIVESINETVYGLLFEIPSMDLEYFVKSEPGYDFIEMEILTKKGLIKAYTFVSHKTVDGIFPHQEYLDTIIRGGNTNGIPKGYLASIINRAGRIH